MPRELIEREPHGELSRLRREVDRRWEDFFGPRGWRVRPWQGEWAPAVDVSETEDKVVIKAEVPGIDPKDLDITLAGDLLTIKGEKKIGTPGDQGKLPRGGAELRLLLPFLDSARRGGDEPDRHQVRKRSAHRHLPQKGNSQAQGHRNQGGKVLKKTAVGAPPAPWPPVPRPFCCWLTVSRGLTVFL